MVTVEVGGSVLVSDEVLWCGVVLSVVGCGVVTERVVGERVIVVRVVEMVERFSGCEEERRQEW